MSTPSLPALPTIPGVPTLPGVGSTAFPLTWVVIHNGNVSDKAVADKIVAYLMAQFPPVLAVSREVAPDADPDPMDFFHGVIIVGGPPCWWPSTSHWHLAYLTAMDPGWKNEGTETAPEWHMVRKSPALDVYNMTASLISSIAGQFPWLSVFNVAGFTDSVKAGDLFCAGERSGIWIGAGALSVTMQPFELTVIT